MTFQRVEVYRNLHKGCFSVRALSGENKGRVIDHVHSITLTDATFVVQPAGRDRVLREGRKNVHAFVRGIITTEPFERGLPVRYDPYLNDAFVVTRPAGPMRSDEIIRNAKQVLMSFEDGHSKILATI